MPIRDQQSSLTTVDSFAGIGVKYRLEPLFNHEAVNPAALRHFRQTSFRTTAVDLCWTVAVQ